MRASTLDELERDPVGRYVRGDTYVHFCAHPTLWGLLLWGRPTAVDARLLGRSLVFELAAPAVPHASVVLATKLEGGDDTAFRALEGYVTRYADLLRAWVLKLAVVRPEGLRGAIVAGVYEVLPRPYPVAVFGDVRRALEWIDPHGAGDAAPPALAEALSALYAAASGAPPFVSALQILLDARLSGIGVHDAARALGVSQRTLQRKLGDAGTTFQREMTDARVRASQRLLEDGDTALTSVALETGFASLQHFNAAFRKRVGQSPGAWREARRTRSARR